MTEEQAIVIDEALETVFEAARKAANLEKKEASAKYPEDRNGSNYRTYCEAVKTIDERYLKLFTALQNCSYELNEFEIS